MTAPAAPDLLAAVLAAHPAELTLMGGGLQLEMTAPGLRVTVYAGDRAAMTRFAMAYERVRRDLRSPAPRCECGDLQTSHDMRLKRSHPCGRHGCACTAWTPSEGAA